jgi:hypothetical protein
MLRTIGVAVVFVLSIPLVVTITFMLAIAFVVSVILVFAIGVAITLVFAIGMPIALMVPIAFVVSVAFVLPIALMVPVALMIAIAFVIPVTLMIAIGMPIALVIAIGVAVVFVFAIALVVPVVFVAIGMPVALMLPILLMLVIGSAAALAFWRRGGTPIRTMTLMEGRMGAAKMIAPSAVSMSEMGLIAAIFSLLGQAAIGIFLADRAVFDHLLDLFILFLDFDVAGQASGFLLLAFAEQELQVVGFGIDLDSVIDQKAGGHAEALDLVAFETPIMDVTGAAGGGIVFENRDPDAEETASRQGFLRSGIVIFRDIGAFGGQHVVFHDLRGIAGNAQTPLDFGAERDEFVFRSQFLIKRPGIIRPIVFCFFADQASADKYFFHNRD